MEGDSVTLYTDIEANQQEKVRWYFKDIQIATIIGDEREVCSEDECKERFRDRLKLDHQTGSLTITNTRTTDSGLYELKVINSGNFSNKIFSVSVHDVPKLDEIKRNSVEEGESVTLDPGIVKNLNGVMTWYFNDIPIAEIAGDQSKICSYDECKERFRDRLKLDHQTGSLTITDTRIIDSGLYKLQINSRNSFSISRISAVLMVIDSGLSSAAVTRICVVVLLTAAAVVVFFYCKCQKRKKGVYTDLCFVTEGDSVILEYYIGKEVRYIWMDHDGEEYFIRNCIHHNWCIFDHKGPGDRLKLYQNGSLAITNTTVTDSGDYSISASFKNGGYFGFSTVVVRGFFSFDTDGVSVMEGDSVTLHTGVLLNQEEKIRWYFNQTEIAEILGYHYSRICTDVQCDKDAVRFRDRLKLDHHWTGSLTITNTRTTDSGLYDLLINSAHRRSSNTKIFIVDVHASLNSAVSSLSFPDCLAHNELFTSVVAGFCAGVVPVSARTRDSLTLRNDVKTNQQEEIRWYFNDTLIAEITGDLSKICTNVRCKEKFKDRLKLDKLGSLVIMYIRTEDAGEYKLQISGSIVEIFSISVASYSVDSGKVSVMEGDLVTLHTDVETNQQDRIRWRFNGIIIAVITGDLSSICTDVQCNNGTERFRDRLKLDHQTGSLTIRDIRTTDSGDYTLEINSSSIQRTIYISVTVT
ncbi:hypothetical protein cypCar_00033348, partial [Cyprinus carpio]